MVDREEGLKMVSNTADQKHVIHLEDVKPFVGTPSIHPKSKWWTLLGPEEVGAERIVLAYVELEPGGYTEPHTHDGTEQAFYFLEGEGVIMVDGKEYKAKPGTAAHVPLNTTHCYRNTGDSSIFFLVIDSLTPTPKNGSKNPGQ